jgi:hypothetical protein
LSDYLMQHGPQLAVILVTHPHAVIKDLAGGILAGLRLPRTARPGNAILAARAPRGLAPGRKTCLRLLGASRSSAIPAPSRAGVRRKGS